MMQANNIKLRSKTIPSAIQDRDGMAKNMPAQHTQPWKGRKLINMEKYTQ